MNATGNCVAFVGDSDNCAHPKRWLIRGTQRMVSSAKVVNEVEEGLTVDIKACGMHVVVCLESACMLFSVFDMIGKRGRFRWKSPALTHWVSHTSQIFSVGLYCTEV